MSFFTMAFTLGIIIGFLLAVWMITYRKKNHLTHVSGMMVAMSVGMMVGVSSGVLAGILFCGDLLAASILSIIVGVISGVITGQMIHILAVLDGLLSGMMGGMMGAMLGGMVTAGEQADFLQVMLVIYSVTMLILLYILSEQGPERYSRHRRWLDRPFLAAIVVALVFLWVHPYFELNVCAEKTYHSYAESIMIESVDHYFFQV